MSFWKNIVTGLDNQTHDLGRWSWALSFAYVLLRDVYQVLHTPTQAPTTKDFCIALAAIVAAHGFALGQKAKTEPQP